MIGSYAPLLFSSPFCEADSKDEFQEDDLGGDVLLHVFVGG